MAVSPNEELNYVSRPGPSRAANAHSGIWSSRQKDQDEAYQKTKEFPPPLFPHAHHPLYQGVANRLCMYSAPFAGTDPVATCGVGCIIGCMLCFVNSSCHGTPKKAHGGRRPYHRRSVVGGE